MAYHIAEHFSLASQQVKLQETTRSVEKKPAHFEANEKTTTAPLDLSNSLKFMI